MIVHPEFVGDVAEIYNRE